VCAERCTEGSNPSLSASFILGIRSCLNADQREDEAAWKQPEVKIAGSEGGDRRSMSVDRTPLSPPASILEIE
jgi:hypothetical protein